jgi:hypothetical protein
MQAASRNPAERAAKSSPRDKHWLGKECVRFATCARIIARQFPTVFAFSPQRGRLDVYSFANTRREEANR